MLGHPIYSPWRGLQNIETAKPFINALRQGRFVLQVCADCARTASPARLHCEFCRSSNLVWRRALGSGVIMGVTTYHKQYDHDYERKIPYNVVLVRLDNAAMVIGMVDAPLEQTDVGRAVQIDIKASAKGMPLKFTLAPAADSPPGDRPSV